MFRNGLTPTHVVIVLVVVVLLFGAKRLPDLAKSVGQSMKIFKSEVKDLRDDEPTTVATTATPPAAPSSVTPVGTVPPVTPLPDPTPVDPVRPAEEPAEGHAPPKA